VRQSLKLICRNLKQLLYHLFMINKDFLSIATNSDQ
jgi:hypothetical protein